MELFLCAPAGFVGRKVPFCSTFLHHRLKNNFCVAGATLVHTSGAQGCHHFPHWCTHLVPRAATTQKEGQLIKWPGEEAAAQGMRPSLGWEQPGDGERPKKYSRCRAASKLAVLLWSDVQCCWPPPASLLLSRSTRTQLFACSQTGPQSRSLLR